MRQLDSPAQAADWLRARTSGQLHTDSRRIGAGDGFIAWPGAATDGRAHVPAALAQGAAACVVERAGLEAFALDDARIASYVDLKAATGPIAAAYYEDPSAQLSLVAVTGTNGKTSTAWWLAQALSRVDARPGRVHGPCALIGTLGLGVPPLLTYTGLTTPDPVTVQRELRRFVEAGFGACAIEASSIGIAERRLDGLHIDVAVFTNFTQDHLDYHGSMDAYWQAKAELFRWPGLRAAVVNVDDLHGASLVGSLRQSGAGPLDLWTTSASGADVRLSARAVDYEDAGLAFTVHEQGTATTEYLATPLIGIYNVANLLGVIGAQRALGVPLAQAVAACRALTGVPGRMEQVRMDGAPLAVVDYAHTPDALDKALEGLRPLAARRKGRLWCVFGCGGNRDPVKRPMMAAVAEGAADVVLLTSDNPRDESPQAIISQVLSGFCTPETVQVEPDRARAIAQAMAAAAPEDVVLLAGKGHESWQEINGKRIPFSDREHAAAAQRVRVGKGVA